jgi:signal transduction histidine kinase
MDDPPNSSPTAPAGPSQDGGDLLTTLRHDIANPLAALLAEAQLLLLAEEPMPEEVRTAIQQIELLALRMRSILQESKQNQLRTGEQNS